MGNSYMKNLTDPKQSFTLNNQDIVKPKLTQPTPTQNNNNSGGGSTLPKDTTVFQLTQKNNNSIIPTFAPDVKTTPSFDFTTKDTGNNNSFVDPNLNSMLNFSAPTTVTPTLGGPNIISPIKPTGTPTVKPTAPTPSAPTETPTAPTTGTETPTKPTYFDMLKAEAEKMYENNMSTAQTTYEQLLQAAEDEALRKKGYTNTRRLTMEKYLPETLRAMGLSNNGLAADAMIGLDTNYTNYYLNALAAEENSKNEASRYLATQKQNAEKLLSEGKLNILEGQKSAWDTLTSLAESGTVDETYLNAMADYYGFDEQQKGTLMDIYQSVLDSEETGEKQSAIEELLMMALSGTDRAALESLGKNAGLTDKEMEDVFKVYDSVQAGIAEDEAKSEDEKNASIMSSLIDIVNSEDYEWILLEAQARTLGLSKADIEYLRTLYDGMEEVRNEEETDEAEEMEESYGKEDYLSAIREGFFDAYSREQLNDELYQRWTQGTLEYAEIAELLNEYDKRILYTSGVASTEEYYTAINGNEDSQNKLDTMLDPTDMETAARAKAAEFGFESQYMGNVVDVSRDNVSWDIFGEWQGNKKQQDYSNAIIADAKAGKIKEGQVVITNFGTRGEFGFYLYVGDGKFVKIKTSEQTNNKAIEKLYVPNRYQYSPWYALGEIRRK